MNYHQPDLFTTPWEHEPALRAALTPRVEQAITVIGVVPTAPSEITIGYAGKAGGILLTHVPNEWPMSRMALALLEVHIIVNGAKPK